MVEVPRAHTYVGAGEPSRCSASLSFPEPTPSPASQTPEPTIFQAFCGCKECTANVLRHWAPANGTDAGPLYTCGRRIDYLMTQQGYNETAACSLVAGVEFPSECAGCNPESCTYASSRPTPTPVDQSLTSPTTPVPTVTPVSKPTQPPALQSSNTSSPTQAPAPQSASTPQTSSPTVKLVSTAAPTQDRGLGATTATPVVIPGTVQPTASPVVTLVTSAPTLTPVASPVSVSSDLVCFPPIGQRTQYAGVWGNFIMEVKEDDITCGPNSNLFSNDTVEWDGNSLTLTFQKIGGQWTGSEVRILLLSGEPFGYGEYSFSVQSVGVHNATTKELLSQSLPVNLVLGMFTHKENQTAYEVDIELSQWKDANNMDGQYVVQPPEVPHYSRFWTGPNSTMDQGGHFYSFTWSPTSIMWETDAGDAPSLLYTTEQALSSGLQDRIQCLPTENLEVRANLWNIDGATAPNGYGEDIVVKVILDGFTYTPSNQEGVADGETCSKDCQCSSGSTCQSNVCGPASS